MSLPSIRRDTSAAFVANVSRQSRTERRVPLREGAASMEILIEGLDVPSYVADIAEVKRHSSPAASPKSLYLALFSETRMPLCVTRASC